MKSVLMKKSLTVLLPTLVGVVGTLLATALPAYHSAFCSGVL